MKCKVLSLFAAIAIVVILALLSLGLVILATLYPIAPTVIISYLV